MFVIGAKGTNSIFPYTSRLITAFHRDHERRYGYSYLSREIELVTLRLRATVKSPKPSLSKHTVGPTQSRRFDPEQISVFFEGRKMRAATYDRDSLRPVQKYSGPAVITEYSATTIVPPGTKFWIDETGNMVVQVRP